MVDRIFREEKSEYEGQEGKSIGLPIGDDAETRGEEQLAGEQKSKEDRSTPESEAFVMVREINRRIAPFCIIERLGSGAMAEIFLAECSETGRKLAVKALRSDIHDATVSARFRLEFDLLRRLNHPTIAKAFAFQTGDPTFFTMEYIDGENLRQHFMLSLRELKTEKRTVEKIISVTHRLLEGLQYLHQNKIIHRDLKPENIMLIGGGEVKLLDFGVARTLEDHLELTCHSEAVGTLEYMAPEMLQNRVFDHRVDLYALGVVVFQLLTGRRLFDVHGLVEIYEAKVGQESPTLDEAVWPEFAWFVDLINHLLKKRPEDRPRSTAEALMRFESHWRPADGRGQERPVEVGASPLISIHNAPLYGRGEVFQQIEDWVMTPRPLPLLLHGASGTGKTRILRAVQTKLIEKRIPCLLIDSREFDRSSTSFLQDVFFKLQDRFGGDSTEADSKLPGTEMDDTVTPAFFVRYVRQILGQVPVILIDDIHLLPEHIFQQILRHFLMARAKSDGPSALWIFSYSDDTPEPSESRLLIPILDILPCSLDLWLQPLDEMAVYHLAVHLMDGRQVDSALVSDFYEYTGGLPFAVAHMLSMMVDNGHVVFRGGQWQLDPSRALEAPGELIEQFLRGKVVQLSVPAQKVLELIAVAGERVSLDFLNQALQGPAGEKDRVLNELIIEQWVHISGSVLSFSNPKTHRLLYRSISEGRRHLIHHWVVRILEKTAHTEDTAHLMQLHRHARLAEDEDRVFKYAMQIGVFFFKQNMFHEAQQYLANAINHFQHEAKMILLEAYLWKAECHLCLDQLSEAMQDLEICLETLHAIPFTGTIDPEKHALMFQRIILHHLALLEGRAGRHWEAEQHRKEIARIHEELLGTFITDPGAYLPLRIVHPEWPKQPLVAATQDLQTLQLYKAAFDTLLEHRRDGTFGGRLAKNWIWDAEHRELTFDLKEGLTYHNDALLHAKDVVFSFNMIREGMCYQPVLTPLASRVEDVRAESKDRVLVTYAPGPPPNLAFWANMPVSPSYLYGHRADSGPLSDNRGLIGSGPFAFDTMNDDGFVFRVADSTKKEKRRFEISPKGWESLNWLRKGKAHLAFLDSEQWHQLTPIDQLKLGVVRGVHLSNQVIRLCFKLDGQAAIPQPIRRALYDYMLLELWNQSYLNHECVVVRDVILTSRAKETHREVMPLHRQLYTEAMEESGYQMSPGGVWERNGSPFSMHLLFPDWPKYRKVFQAMAHFMGRRGIQVRPRFLKTRDLKKQIKDESVNGWVDHIFPEPDYGGIGDFLHSKSRTAGANDTGYASQEMDALIAALEQTPPGRRTAIQRKIDKLFKKDLPWLPLYQVKVYYAFSARLQGLAPDRRGVISNQSQLENLSAK